MENGEMSTQPLINDDDGLKTETYFYINKTILFY